MTVVSYNLFILTEKERKIIPLTLALILYFLSQFSIYHIASISLLFIKVHALKFYNVYREKPIYWF